MDNMDFKYAYKTSYRINGRIKSIIDTTFRDIQKETGLKLSLGKVSRAFWVSLANDPALRKKFIDSVQKTILQEAIKKNGHRQPYTRKRSSLH